MLDSFNGLIVYLLRIARIHLPILLKERDGSVETVYLRKNLHICCQKDYSIANADFYKIFTICSIKTSNFLVFANLYGIGIFIKNYYIDCVIVT